MLISRINVIKRKETKNGKKNDGHSIRHCHWPMKTEAITNTTDKSFSSHRNREVERHKRSFPSQASMRSFYSVSGLTLKKEKKKRRKIKAVLKEKAATYALYTLHTLDAWFSTWRADKGKILGEKQMVRKMHTSKEYMGWAAT